MVDPVQLLINFHLLLLERAYEEDSVIHDVSLLLAYLHRLTKMGRRLIIGLNAVQVFHEATIAEVVEVVHLLLKKLQALT